MDFVAVVRNLRGRSHEASSMTKGENALVDWLRMRFGSKAAGVPIGIGDDMAVLEVHDDLVAVTADMLLDGVHFDTQVHAYDAIGRKAIACSLSDCAAMACQPRAAVVSVALPEQMTMDDVKRLYEGMAGIAEEFECAIVGGDTNSWKGPLAVDVTILAEPIGVRGPVQRSTAQIDDIVYVSGPLGGSLSGRHMTFTPQVDLAAKFVDQPGLHAMMDLSDGLSMDLFRLCGASHCAAEIDVSLMESAISEAARAMAMKDKRSPLEHALHDGEDYELLVTGTDALRHERFLLTAVGRIVARGDEHRPVLTLVHPDGRREPLEPQGYEHFR